MQTGKRGRPKTGPSIKDVARMARVSAQTVSRVSNGSGSVRPETRAKVLEAMAQLGYAPNRAARALRSGRFGTIGLIAHRFGRTGETQSAGAVLKAAAAAGYSVTMLEIEEPDEEHWETAAARLSSQAIDALIVIRAEHEAPETLSLPPLLPVAASDSRLAGHYPAVAHDQVGGGRAATAHLLALGHTCIHHVSGPTDSEAAVLRQSAWQQTLAEAGLVAPRPWLGDWTPASGYRVGLEIAKDPTITAVFAANDEMAFGLLLALHESGRRVPEEVSVVGFDGIELAAFSYPPLTTVRQDFAAEGEALVKMVLHQIHDRQGYTPSQRVVIPSELIVRGTTAPPR